MTTAWLRDLEERVQEASERLRALQTENAGLKERVGELEAQLQEAPSGKEAAAWTEERGDIKQRVEKLVQHLDDLLKD